MFDIQLMDELYVYCTKVGGQRHIIVGAYQHNNLQRWKIIVWNEDIIHDNYWEDNNKSQILGVLFAENQDSETISTG